MFTNKAQASRLTPIFSAGSSKFCLSVVCIWRKSKSKRYKSITKSLVWAAQRGPFISSATHTTCIFLSFSVSIFHFLYLKHKYHYIIYAIGYVQSISDCRLHTLRMGSGGSGTDKRDRYSNNCRLTVGVRFLPSGWLKICLLVFINHHGNVSGLTDARAPLGRGLLFILI